MSTTSKETAGHHDRCLNYEFDKETCSCTCSNFDGFKRNTVFNHSLSTCGGEIGDEDDSESEEQQFEINLTGPLDTIREEHCESSVFSLDIHDFKDVVYVAVEDGDSSMEALSWTLKHAVTPSSIVCLVHVFPVLRLLPNPLGVGHIPRSHVSPKYVNMYLTEEEGKRKVPLQRFIDLCIASKVHAEMMLIEGDKVAKAIVDLVTKLGIRKLVIGITKSNLSETGSGKPKAVADEVVENVPEICDVKIICQGKEVIDQIIKRASSRSSDSSSSPSSHTQDRARGSFVRFIRSVIKMNKDGRGGSLGNLTED